MRARSEKVPLSVAFFGFAFESNTFAEARAALSDELQRKARVPKT